MLTPYWNKREAVYWLLIVGIVGAYAIGVLAFNVDPIGIHP
jgi:hypothetical protein